jgi:pSer/pThr/pTyr-binding forkhead associated (FHA) protein
VIPARPPPLPRSAVNEASFESFAEACGLVRPARLHIGLKGVKEMAITQPVRQPFLLVGRGSELDVPLNHWQVSRRHAYLQLRGGRIFFHDLGSRAETRSKRTPGPSGWIDYGERLAIGPYRLWFSRADPDEPGREPVDPEALPDPGAALELPGDLPGPARRQLEHPVTLLGASPRCEVSLPDPDLCQLHCSLVRTPKGVWVVDLRSRSGTRVNGAAVRCAYLEDGDELQLGRFRLRLRYDQPPPTPLRRDDFAQARPIPPAVLPGVPALVPPLAGQLMLGRPPDQAAPGENALLPIVQQFALMQQQMLDQFHQVILAVVQLLGAPQRDQVAALREDLDGLRRLTLEIHRLQTDAAALPPAAGQPAQGFPGKPATIGTRPEANGALPRRQVAPGTPPSPVGERPAASATAAEGRPEPPDPGQNQVHTVLEERIAALADQQRSHWQRILEVLGGGSDRPRL